MRTGPIILVIGFAAAIGWMAPGLPVHAPENSGNIAQPTPTKAEKPAGWSSGGAELERGPDGHFYADVIINAAPAHVLVDTGASIVALTAQDARAAGLDWDDADKEMIGQGASGPVYGIPVKLDAIELGGTEQRGVDAAIIPEGLGVSLLGQSFLSRLGAVQIEGDRMTIGQP